MDKLRSAILAKARNRAGDQGWSEDMLLAAARDAGIGRDDLALAFPDGVFALLRHFCTQGDREMAAALKDHPLEDMRIRDRVALGVLTRIDVDRDFKPAVRQAVTAFSQPRFAALGLGALYDTADAIWCAIGDDARDYNRYTKRTILAGVYGATIMVWLSDQTEDLAKTRPFLDARIENVMQFEKAKAGFAELFGHGFQRR